MRKLLLVVLMLLPCYALADDRALLDASRAAGGLGVNALYDADINKIYACPNAWLSWSATENLALKVVQEWNTDKGIAKTPIRIGARMYIPDSLSAMRVGLGVNYLRDWESNSHHDWSVGVYAGWKAARNLAVQASYEKVVYAGRREARVGLAYKLFGGK